MLDAPTLLVRNGCGGRQSKHRGISTPGFRWIAMSKYGADAVPEATSDCPIALDFEPARFGAALMQREGSGLNFHDSRRPSPSSKLCGRGPPLQLAVVARNGS